MLQPAATGVGKFCFARLKYEKPRKFITLDKGHFARESLNREEKGNSMIWREIRTPEDHVSIIIRYAF